MDFLNGSDRILFIKIDGIWMPVGCLTSNGIQENAETIETTTRDNEGWKTDKVIIQGYSINFSGIMLNSTIAGGNFNVASYDKIVLLKRQKLILDWKLQGSKYPIVDYGKCQIIELSEIESVNEFMSFSGTLLGFGKPYVQSLNEIVLNNGDPNTLVITENNELIKVS